MISIKNKFLFIHIPKTGGNSIQTVLNRYSDDEITVNGVVIKNSEQTHLDRFGVKYKDFELGKHSSLKEYNEAIGNEIDGLYKFATIRNPWDRAVSFYFSPHRGKVEWDKQKFIQFVSSQVEPVRHYLTLETGDDFLLNVDRIIKFEDLAKHFNEVALKLNLEQTKLPHRNQSKKQHYSYYYDKELIEFIGEHFKEDIKIGDYEFSKQV